MRYVKVILFTVLLGTGCGVLLVGISAFTQNRIKANEEFTVRSSILEAFGISFTKETINELFKDNVTSTTKSGFTFHKARDGAVAFEIKGPGLWGPIYGVICLEPDLAAIRRITVLHQEETPGLGARIEESEFLAQFKGKRILPKLIFLPQGKARASNEVDSITGATGSSKAFEKLLNENVQRHLAVIK